MTSPVVEQPVLLVKIPHEIPPTESASAELTSASDPEQMPVTVSHRQVRRDREQSRTELPRERECSSYSRYSTDHQNNESVADQQRVCREFAVTLELRIPQDLEFADEAVSGTKLHRVGLDAMLRAAKQGRFQVLLVHSLSRLAREMVITLPLLKKLVYRYGVRFISVTEGIDSARDDWETAAAIYSLFHERYVKELRSNVLRGQEGTVYAGMSVGDWCFGYGSEPIPDSELSRKGKNPKPRKRYVVNEVQAAWVRSVFDWFVRERRPIRWIVRQLNHQRVPKDHRSKTSEWRYDLVISLLSNPKYIGIWPWGEKTNVRDPETGNLKQEYRQVEESDRWKRHFPDLQIVPTELFEEAQQKLKANTEKWGNHRKDKGHLCGSTAECNGRTSTRLLSGLMVCDACGGPMIYISGRLRCRNHERGLCEVKSSIPADIAEHLVVQEIRENLCCDTLLFERIYQISLNNHRKFMSGVPQELESKKRELMELDQRIARLVDSIEAGTASLDVTERLRLRNQERSDLTQQISRLNAGAGRHAKAPTRDWVREQFNQMRDRLNESGAVANEVLKDLIDGPIRVAEIGTEKQRGRIMRGQFRLSVRRFLQGQNPLPGEDPDEATNDLISIDFVDDHQIETRRVQEEELQERAKQLFDQGLLNVEIAEQLGVARSRATVLIQNWHTSRGLPVPDGRARRFQLEKSQRIQHLYQKISDRVMELYHEGLLLDEIADLLNVDRNTITSSVAYWHKSRNLPVPDGRTRRKSLARKSR
ncbi:MAG: recombinase family protein [Planctomycetaceae bacterium]